jgi:hypothetical protein
VLGNWESCCCKPVRDKLSSGVAIKPTCFVRWLKEIAVRLRLCLLLPCAISLFGPRRHQCGLTWNFTCLEPKSWGPVQQDKIGKANQAS